MYTKFDCKVAGVNKSKAMKAFRYFCFAYAAIGLVVLIYFNNTVLKISDAANEAIQVGDAQFTNTPVGKFAIESFRSCQRAKTGVSILNMGYPAFSAEECKNFTVAQAKAKSGDAFSDEVNGIITARLKHEDKWANDEEIAHRMRVAAYALEVITFGLKGGDIIEELDSKPATVVKS